jgi:tetratricopeptide (TPR) repeat protein
MRFLRLVATTLCLATASRTLCAKIFEVPSSANHNAIMLHNDGTVELRKGNLEQALHFFDAAIQTDPSLWLAYYNRARVFARQHKWEVVIRDTTVVLREPQWLTDAGALRGVANQELGHYGAALADFDKVISFHRQDTATARALNGRAWLRATCPDAAFRNGPLALEDAKRAATMLKTASVIDTLAAAFAEVGDFDSAIGCERLALPEIKPSTIDGPKLKLSLQKHLSSFTQHRPWRSTPNNPFP